MLTAKQRETLQLRADGLSHKQIAAKLGVSIGSVDDHFVAIKKKLKAKTGHHAVAEALRLGYIR